MSEAFRFGILCYKLNWIGRRIVKIASPALEGDDFTIGQRASTPGRRRVRVEARAQVLRELQDLADQQPGAWAFSLPENPENLKSAVSGDSNDFGLPALDDADLEEVKAIAELAGLRNYQLCIEPDGTVVIMVDTPDGCRSP